MKEYKREYWIDSTNETPLEFSIGVTESECFDEYAEKAKEELNCLRENIITDRETIACLRQALDAANEKLIRIIQKKPDENS